MGTPKPTELPRFAELDQLSPVLTNNVIEPPESYKKYGHNFREKYKRNFFNWLHRLTYEWINYLNEQTIINGQIGVDIPELTGSPNAIVRYGRSGNNVVVLFQITNNILPVTTPPSVLTITPDGGVWPDELVTNQTIDIPVVIYNDGRAYVGSMRITGTTTTPWALWSPLPPSDGGYPNYNLAADKWYGNAGFPAKGFHFALYKPNV